MSRVIKLIYNGYFGFSEPLSHLLILNRELYLLVSLNQKEIVTFGLFVCFHNTCNYVHTLVRNTAMENCK